ncbi:MAG: lamin tail domain-containing protein [Acidobacteriota bacterium]
MPCLRQFCLVLLIVAFLCLMLWPSALTQSPLQRITNTSEESINLNPSISGDGRVVGFESTDDVAAAGGVESFRAIRANVSVDPPTFLQLGATRAPAPAISQDGSRIAFASKDNPLGANNDANSEIFLYDGAKLVQVTNTSPVDISLRAVNGNFLPSISDDGRFIAFSSNRDLTNQNADGNLEIFIFDTVALSFTQLTNTSGIVGSTNAKISGNGASVAFIRDPGTPLASPSAKCDLLLQNRVGPPAVRVLASAAQSLAMTYGRAISDDGQRVVWSAETTANTTQVFLFDGRNNNTTRQITSLGARATDVQLHPTISGNGSRIAFATRRGVSGLGSNSDTSVELYTFDIPSSTFGRVTNVNSSSATADVLCSMSDDGAVIAFNYPRILSGAVSNNDFSNNSEIYVTGTPGIPSFGTLTILNRASMGHELSSIKAVAPDSIALASGSSLSFQTQQAQRQAEGTFPVTVGGTTVTVNDRRAQIFFVSPTEVHFHVPAATEIGNAEVVVTNSDGFQSRGTVPTLRAAPGVFTTSGDGLGEGMILNADTLTSGPFNPTSGNLRLTIFATGVRNGSAVSVTAGGRTLVLESILAATEMPGMDEIHVIVPADLRGAVKVDLVVRADGRDSNPAAVEFIGDARRDILINEFMADTPDGAAGDANRDGSRDTSQDEFVELVNTTTHDIDISGYQILNRSATGTSDTLRHTFSTRTIIPACTAIVVFGGGTFDPNHAAFAGSQVVKASSGSLTLINSAGVITLRDPAGTIAGFVTYGGSSGLDADDNQSLTRLPDIAGPFAKHGAATVGARLFSPGTQLNGLPFSSCTPAIARVEVSPASAILNIGQQQQFTGRAFDGSNNEVPGVIFYWQSSNTAVAMIDQNGLATGMSAGSTQILATGRGVQSTPATLMVNQPPPELTSITISPTNATISVGGSQQFTAQAKDQFGQNIGGVTITFASHNATVASVDSVSPTSSNGFATATVTGHLNGVSEIRAAATNGTATVTSGAATVIVEPAAGQLLISEFRTRGPAGAADEFVEIYNPTTSTLIIGGLKIRTSNSAGTISDRVIIVAGTTLGPGCHYLAANSSAGGYSGSVPADQAYATGLADDGGIAVTGSNGANIIDAVGMSSGSSYNEGTPLAPLANNVNRSYERKPGGTFGNGTDTNHNVVDFLLNTGGSNPQNLSTGCLDPSTADLSITKTGSPDPVIVGSDVTYSITITNNGAGLAQSVVITDNLPSTVSFVSCHSTGGGICGGSGNSRTVTFTSLASGASATVTLVARANGPAATISSTASVNSSTPDSNTGNNSASSITVIQAPAPGLTITDVTANEGSSGTTTFTFTVSLSSPAPENVSFDISTQDNTATVANNDYVGGTLTNQTIPAGQQSYNFTVAVNGDAMAEPDESFFANVTNVAGATVTDGQGLGTILNDDVANLVISKLYAAGGNSGAQFTHDFVEIFNRGATTVNFAITPYSVQYAGATASFGSKVDLTSGTIAPGQYFLVQLSGGASGAPLPTPDVSGSIVMAGTAGKVALVVGTTSLTGSGCPLSASVADFIGYGATANCFEGVNGPAPAPGNSTADFRRAGGCSDTNDNAADFFLHAPAPRNTSLPLNDCVPGTPTTLAITDVAMSEGNSGSRIFTFTVSLSAPIPATDVVFDLATQNKTATTANDDYEARTLTNQIIPAGQQIYTFDVTVNGDTTVEPDETFVVNVTNATGSTVTDGQGQGTILNDDLPNLSINDVSLAESNSGTKVFNFTVALSAPAASAVAFDIATQDDTATVADNDYVSQALMNQSIPAGQQTYIFAVVVKGDVNVEGNETFFVNLTNVSGAAVSDSQGLGTIQNDDSILLTINDVAIDEGNSSSTIFTFTVSSSLPAPVSGLSFNIAAQDGSATSSSGDYASKSLTNQTIPAGQQTYTFDVTINGDLNVEPAETFLVNLTNVNGGTVVDGQGLGTIENDDAANLVISQLYAGGGNAGASFTNDFVEIFNRGTTTVNFATTTYSIQYTGATANFGSNKVDLTAGTIFPGQYFLFQLSGGASGTPLPTPDASGSINMAATAGKVSLVAGTTSLPVSTCPGDDGTAPFNPNNPNIADFVGYGSSAICYEGPTGPAPAQSATTADFRKAGGCTDTDDNAADFLVAATSPRNTNAPANDCSAPPPPPILTINDVSGFEGNGGAVTFALTFTVALSAPAPAGGVSFNIATQDNTATAADSDYVPQTLTSQTIPAGNSVYTFEVTVNGDLKVESNETFFVNLTNISGATIGDSQGLGTIQNDDNPTLTITDVSANESNSGTTTFTFTVTSSLPAPAGGITFDIATADVIAQDHNPPTEDNDYVAKSLTAQIITAGNTTYTFQVTVNGDTLVESNETFLVSLTNAAGATIVDGQAQGTIQNDDTANLVISQVYAGGGNSGAQFTNDFVEIFNRATTTVDFAATPYSIQYAGATANFGSNKVNLISGAIAPGKYYLVQLSSAGAIGTALPAADAVGSINMAATAGKVSLVAGTTSLPVSTCPGDDGAAPFNPNNPNIADFVGYGSSAICYEGPTGPAPVPSATTANILKAGGCTDTDDNAADFFVHAPGPRNSSSSLNNCSAGTPPNLSINDVTTAEGNSGSTIFTFSVSLSAPAPSTDVTFDVATQNNTATNANNDYVARSLTSQIIPAGQDTSTFDVTIKGDIAIELDETFFVNVTNVTGAAVTDGQAVGTILNDDLPTLSLSDVSLAEGNSGTKNFSFTVNLSAPASSGGVTFDIATQDNTATVANNDYIARALTGQSISAGQQSYAFDVTVNGDLDIEANETFFVNITNVNGAIVSDNQGVGTIQNDDSPALSINDVVLIEGNSGTSTASFAVTSSLPAPAGGITFNIATEDNTAHASSVDYVSKSLTSQTIPAGQTAYTFDVTVNGDTLVESNETFLVKITSVSSATVADDTGQGTIQNDDTPLLVISQFYGGGGNTGASFTHDFIEIFNRGTTTVNLSGWSVQYVSATGTGTWSVTNLSGTIRPGQYYLVQEGSSGANGNPLPTPDATGSIAMAAGLGKIALVSVSSALAGGCPSSSNISDLAGYGATANCFEGAGPAPTPSATTADFRKAGGCTDINNNAADFLSTAPNPRNSVSPFNNCNAADISISKADSPDPVTTGTNVTYTIGVSNNGPADAQSVVVTDNLPVTVSFVSCSSSGAGVCSGIGNNRTITFSSLASGASETITLVATAHGAAGSTIPNTATVATVTPDSNSANNSATTTTDVQAPPPEADLSVTKTVPTAAPVVGQEIVFTITLNNSGPSTATAVQVTDLLPSGLVFVSSTVSQGSYDNSTGLWNVGAVNNSASATLTITARVQTRGTKTNTATITASGATDPISSNNQSSVTLTPGLPLLVISQLYTAGGASAAVYNRDFIEIFNRGTAPINLSGFSVQYAASGTGTFTVIASLPAVTLQSRQYFLVSAGTSNASIGSNLPVSADVAGSNTNMTGSAGKVAIAFGTVALTSSNVNNPPLTVGNPSPGCPANNTIVVDFVGYGTTAACFEGTTRAPDPTAMNNSQADYRNNGGCTDNNSNGADFARANALPRNSSTIKPACP